MNSNILARAKSILVSKAIVADEDRKRRAATWVLEPASPNLIFEMVKKMQVLKGRTYAEVAKRMYGDECNQQAMEFVEKQICEMMSGKHVTVSELTEWYRMTIETVYEHTKFQPLPDYSACVKAVDDAQESTFRLRQAASNVLDDNPVLDAIQQIGQHTESRTLPDLFSELKRKLE
ncbi:hypothetical protein [Prosthecochloris sp.]|uniref:hypothetical protein n=1 Tax=Prosthecochloris sp. TaxID=290513 RepID=UPI00257B1568|nr:hypothetical protein [Prosthecochloris sp.]